MDEQPSSFGRYKVKGVIGKGAMGVIYLAEDPVIGRQLAIKVIQLNPGISSQEIENLQVRFEREFRSAGTLSHPNIVVIHDVGKEGNTPYIGMEYVEGKTLEHLIAEQRVLSFEEVADLVGQICDGLDYAHQHGVVHRDVKPANILLDRNGRPKITDFGVAKLTESGMTHTGTMVGTPWYMSPEQVVGEQVTGAADQFSVAVMTYQLLTRERPFTGERSSTVLYKIVHEEPVRPHLLNPKLMDRLDDALMRAFAKNPVERYPTCNEFAAELRAALGVAAARSNKTMAGATPATEWPTASMTLDKELMKEWQEAANKSGAKSGAGSGARSGAQSAARSAAASSAQPSSAQAAPDAPPPPPSGDPHADATLYAKAPAEAPVPVASPTPAPAKPSKADLKRQAKAAKEAKAREEKAAADAARAAKAAAAQAAAQAAQAKSAEATATPAQGVDVKAAAAKATAKPAAAKAPAGAKKGLGVGALVGIVAVVLALGAGAFFLMSGGGASDDVATTAEPAPALDVAPVEDAPQPLPPELTAETAALPAAPEGADAAALPQTYRIVTRPVGATITIDGAALETVTPAEIELPHDAKHLIELALEGHKPVRWTFVADKLSADQQRTRTLYFPLPAVEVAPAPEQVQAAKAAPAAPPPMAAAAAPPVELPSSPAGVIDKSLKTVRGGREVPMPRKIIDAGPIYDKSLVPPDKSQPVVVLELTLDPEGDVANAKVLSGLTPALDEIARRTSYRWKYEVNPNKGKPVNTIVTGTVVFQGQ